jgi:hypothetical protein
VQGEGDGSESSAEEPSGGVTLALSAEERAILCKSLRGHRRSIPIYLKSGEKERQLVDDLLARLSCPP